MNIYSYIFGHYIAGCVPLLTFSVHFWQAVLPTHTTGLTAIHSATNAQQQHPKEKAIKKSAVKLMFYF